jgi:hypothetical protein
VEVKVEVADVYRITEFGWAFAAAVMPDVKPDPMARLRFHPAGPKRWRPTFRLA